MKRKNLLALLTSLVMLVTMLVPAYVMASGEEETLMTITSANPEQQNSTEEGEATGEETGDQSDTNASADATVITFIDENNNQNQTEDATSVENDINEEEVNKEDSNTVQQDAPVEDVQNQQPNLEPDKDTEPVANTDDKNDESPEEGKKGNVDNAFPQEQLSGTVDPEKADNGDKVTFKSKFVTGQALDYLKIVVTPNAHLNATKIKFDAIEDAVDVTYNVYKIFNVDYINEDGEKKHEDNYRMPLAENIPANAEKTISNLDEPFRGIENAEASATGMYVIEFNAPLTKSVAGKITVEGTMVDATGEDKASVSISASYSYDEVSGKSSLKTRNVKYEARQEEQEEVVEENQNNENDTQTEEIPTENEQPQEEPVLMRSAPVASNEEESQGTTDTDTDAVTDNNQQVEPEDSMTKGDRSADGTNDDNQDDADLNNAGDDSITGSVTVNFDIAVVDDSNNPIAGIDVVIGRYTSPEEPIALDTKTTDEQGKIQYSTPYAVLQDMRFTAEITEIPEMYDESKSDVSYTGDLVMTDETTNPATYAATATLVLTRKEEPIVGSVTVNYDVTVVDDENNPVEGATVVLGRYTTQEDDEPIVIETMSTDEQGKVQYTTPYAVLADMRFTASVSEAPEGFDTAAESATFVGDLVETDGTTNPATYAATATLTLPALKEIEDNTEDKKFNVVLLDKETNDPVSGVAVSVEWAGNNDADPIQLDGTTNDEGIATFNMGNSVATDENPWTVTLQLNDTEYDNESNLAINPANYVTDDETAVVDSFTIKLIKTPVEPEYSEDAFEATFSAQVYMINSEDGSQYAAPAGIALQVGPSTSDNKFSPKYNMTTDENGFATLTTMAEPGNYVIKVNKSGWENAENYATSIAHIKGAITEESPVLAGDIILKTNAQAKLRKFTVNAYDSQTHAGIKDVKFSLKLRDGDTSYELNTDENGKAVINEVDEGTYILSIASAPEQYAINPNRAWEYSVVSDMSTSFNISKKQEYIDPKATFNIQVINSETRESISGVSVVVMNGNEVVADNIATGENGIVKVEELPAGTYTVSVDQAPAGYEMDETSSLEVVVEKTGNKDIQLTVTPIPPVEEDLEIVEFTGLTFDPEELPVVPVNQYNMPLTGFNLKLNKEDVTAAQVKFILKDFTSDMQLRMLFDGSASGYAVQAITSETGTGGEVVVQKGSTNLAEDRVVVDFDSRKLPVVDPESGEVIPDAEGSFPANTKFLWIYIYNPSSDFAVKEFAISGTTPNSLTMQQVNSIVINARTEVSLDGTSVDATDNHNGKLVIGEPEADLTLTASAEEVFVDDDVSFVMNFANTTETKYINGRFDFTVDNGFVPATLNLGAINNYDGKIRVQTVDAEGNTTDIGEYTSTAVLNISSNPSNTYRIMLEEELNGTESVSSSILTGKYSVAGDHTVTVEFEGKFIDQSEEDGNFKLSWKKNASANIKVKTKDAPTTEAPTPTDDDPTPTPPPTDDPSETPTDEVTPTPTPDSGGHGGFNPPSGGDDDTTPTPTPVPLTVDTPNIYANSNTIAYGDDAIFNIRNLNAIGMNTDNYYVLHIMIPTGVQVKSLSFPGFGGSIKVSLAYQSGSTELGTYMERDTVALSERQGSNLRYISFQMRNMTAVNPDGEITLMLKNISARDRVATLQAILSVRDATTAVREQHYDKYNIALAGPKTPTTTSTTPGTSNTPTTPGTNGLPADTSALRTNNLSAPYQQLVTANGLFKDGQIDPKVVDIAMKSNGYGNEYEKYPLLVPTDKDNTPEIQNTGAENVIDVVPVTNDRIRSFVYLINKKHDRIERFVLYKSDALMVRILRAAASK